MRRSETNPPPEIDASGFPPYVPHWHVRRTPRCATYSSAGSPSCTLARMVLQTMCEIPTWETAEASEAPACAVWRPLGSIGNRCDRPSSKVQQRAHIHPDDDGLLHEVCRNSAASQSGGPTLAKAVVERICAVYGTPLRLLSDRGPSFESESFKEMCAMLGIEKYARPATNQGRTASLNDITGR